MRNEHHPESADPPRGAPGRPGITGRLALAWAVALSGLWAPTPSTAQQRVNLEDISRDPAAAAALESQDDSPRGRLRRALTLAGLGYPKLAQPLLAAVLADKPADGVLLELQQEFGSHTFMALSSDPRLAPAGGRLAEAVLAAADRHRRDPQRLARLLTELGDDDPALRQAALVDLRAAGEAGIGALVGALAAPRPPIAADQIGAALEAMGDAAAGPLSAALQSSSAPLRARAARALGRFETRESLPLLVARAVVDRDKQVRRAAADALTTRLGASPDVASARRLLERQVAEYLDGPPPITGDHRGQASLWQWDNGKKRPVVRRVAAADTGTLLAAPLAADLARLAPDDRRLARLGLATRLEAVRIARGYGKPLPADPGTARAEAESHDLGFLESFLAWAIERDMLAAAEEAIDILAARGTPALLQSDDGGPTPLVRAATHADRRLRFAALAAIMKLAPREPFAGASRVAESLGFFAAAGPPRAVVGHPRAAEARTMAALLGQLGYETEIAHAGRALLGEAAGRADVDLIVVHTDIDRPPLREVLYRLRREPDTAGLPIGLVATADALRPARRIAADDRLTDAFPRVTDRKAMQFQVDRLHALAGRRRLSDEERLAQAGRALNWLAALAERPHSFYDLQRQVPAAIGALDNPRLTPLAARAVASLGTAAGQTALVDLASRPTVSLARREAAAAAFARSVARHGTLLTGQQIGQQYDRYNASESADRDTQRLLGTLLDILEKKHAPVSSGAPSAPPAKSAG